MILHRTSKKEASSKQTSTTLKDKPMHFTRRSLNLKTKSLLLIMLDNKRREKLKLKLRPLNKPRLLKLLKLL
jgi:hypothetical protein